MDKCEFVTMDQKLLVVSLISTFRFEDLHVLPFLAAATRPETICPGTSKLACWRVQLATASKVGRRGAGPATASIEASVQAGDISHPLAQMVPFILASKLCRPPA
jgi:hypothetical protein